MRLQIVLLAWLAWLPVPCMGWNGPGHNVIGLIAWDQLDEATKRSAVALLKAHPRYEQHFLGRMPENVWSGSPAEQEQWLFAHAGTWPDLVRGKSDVVTADDVQRYNRPNWHYINLPVYLTPEDRDTLAAGLTTNRATDIPDDRDAYSMNVVQAIGNSLRIVRDEEAPTHDRAVHLCWVLHLIGDAHQPCHAAALFSRVRFPEGDRGGNQIPTKGRENLHSMWDAAILPRSDYNRIRKEAFELSSSGAEAGADALKVTGVADWLRESHRLASTRVYTEHIRSMIAAAEGRRGDLGSVNPPNSYYAAAGRLAKERAVAAGYRIAAQLNGQLSPPSDVEPSQPGVIRPQRGPVAPQATTPVRSSLTAAAAASGEQPTGFWLNTSSGVRHNANCKSYCTTKRGYYCTADEGKACGICGG